MAKDITNDPELDKIETTEWLESLDYVIKHRGPDRVLKLLGQLQNRAAEFGIHVPFTATTPYINTISRDKQPVYPGNRQIERRIKSLIRWNAMSMVVRANRNESGIGGHISTFASAATLYEVGFNHFFKGPDHPEGSDMIYFQGHAAPGIYARAFLEGRLEKKQLENFRRELAYGGGLSSYPHPYLMPGFWQFPTVSMGLGPIMSIYQARFNRYLEDRGIIKKSGKVWAFLGDGETDEPETLGAISLASRENLDNLVFVINCNLQRLDGPVRGNGKIIQELEAVFRGAGWNVIKVIWGSNWDPLLERDEEGVLVERMNTAIDGEYQKLSIAGADYVRKNFFGTDERLAKMVESLSDADIKKLNRGGHDPEKVYAAYHLATQSNGRPTVILAKTIKGYGLGESGEGKNITHQQKKLNEEELRHFRSRFGIPVSDDDVGEAGFYRPAEDSSEIEYLQQAREKLGGSLPQRTVKATKMPEPDAAIFDEYFTGSEGKETSTTMIVVRILTRLLKDKDWGPRIVPIIPDEARTFGMEALFRQVGIYSHVGQKYEPVDRDTLLYYKEARDGQILEEGITEAGAISSFIAAATASATHGVHMVPFFLFYSMFGLQRIGDLIWAGGDMKMRGFLIGGTAGRTTLAGEGLQHQDGNSQLLAYPHPNLQAYDPSFAYEIAIIIQEGLKRMYVQEDEVFYYLTVENEPYAMPRLPQHISKTELADQVMSGIYLFKPAEENAETVVQLLGSGAIMNEVIKAAELLKTKFNVDSEIFSVTSYKELHFDGLKCEEKNLESEKEYIPRVTDVLKTGKKSIVVAASDYVKAVPHTVARWVENPYFVLGTDGFGLSESRKALRQHFKVDAQSICITALSGLAKHKLIDNKTVQQARAELS